MNARIQTHAAHTDGLAYAGLVINNVFLHYGVQNLVIRRDVYGFGGFDGAVNVGLRDFALLDFYHTLRIHAADMVAGNAGYHAADLAIGHQLGFFHSLGDGLGGGIDIGYHTGLQAV